MKRRSGINMSDVKMSNRGLILNQIKMNPKPRKDIAEKIKLTPAAVTILVNELIDQGCIRELGHVNEPSRVGRKKVFIEINKNYKYAIGVSIEGNHLNICLGNLKSEVLDFVNIKITGKTADEVMSIVIESINTLMNNRSLSVEQMIGVGVGVGIVDIELDISKRAYGLWKEDVQIEKILSDALNMQIVVENNVRVLALAEMELTLHRRTRNMVFMKLGPGIESAIILDNDIYKGSYNSSGELGHMVIDIEGKKCLCGQVGCLETVASIASLIRDIKENFNKETYPVLYDSIHGDVDGLTEEEIIEAYIQGDESIVEKVDRLIYYLSIGIINSFKFYDPHKLILYSKMFREPMFLEKLIQEILKHDSSIDLSTRIEPSRLEMHKSIGGLVLVINELFFKVGAME